MKQRIRSNYTFFNVLLFFLGLFSATNAIYLFKIGNALVYPIYVISIISFLSIVFKSQYQTGFSRDLPKELIVFLACIFLSLITTLLFNGSYLRQWLAGIFNIIFCILIISFIVKNYGRLDWLFYGIIAGILVNALFGIVQLAFYLRGDIFSLKPFFPDANISVPNNWNEFCTLGLFKEQGHLMRYLAIFAFPILSFARRKSKALFALMIFVIFIQMIMTASATLALFAVGCGIYLLILLLKKPKHGFLLLLIITVSFFLILFLSSIYSPVNKALQSLFNGLSDFSLSNGNSVRVLGITKGIELVKNYPIIGSGYNTVSMLFIENGYYGVDNVHGTYSAALSLIIELGIGCLPFFYFVLSKAFKLSLTKNKMGVALGVSLFIYLLVFLLTDYAFDGGSSVFIGIVLAFVKSQSSDGQRCGLHRKKANLFSGNSISQAI